MTLVVQRCLRVDYRPPRYHDGAMLLRFYRLGGARRLLVPLT